VEKNRSITQLIWCAGSLQHRKLETSKKRMWCSSSSRNRRKNKLLSVLYPNQNWFRDGRKTL